MMSKRTPVVTGVGSKSKECEVCCELFNASVNAPVVCGHCEITICRNCVRRYVLSNNEQPHCMGCKKMWDIDTYTRHLLKSFILGPYAEHMKKYLYDIELSKMPETMPAVETYKKKLVIQEKIDIINMESGKITDRINIENKNLHVQAVKRDRLERELRAFGTAEPVDKVPGVFIKACPSRDCLGYLSSKWTCEVCSKETCSKCYLIKDEDEHGNETKEEHVCKQENLESVKLIKKENKNCPGCGTSVTKLDGCDQMWCTMCHVGFSWNTGRRVVGVIHNPHFYAWVNSTTEGEPVNAPLAVMCGGIPDYRTYNSLIRKYIAPGFRESYDKLNSLHRISTHFERVELFDLRTRCAGIINNENLRVKFIMKEITEAKFKSLLKQKKTTREKNIAVLAIYELMHTVFTESLRDITVKLNKHYAIHTTVIPYDEMLSVLSNVTRCHNMRAYANEELGKISYLYNLSTKEITKSFGLVNRKWSKKDVLRKTRIEC
jgi:hypothetical protein